MYIVLLYSWDKIGQVLEIRCLGALTLPFFKTVYRDEWAVSAGLKNIQFLLFCYRLEDVQTRGTTRLMNRL